MHGLNCIVISIRILGFTLNVYRKYSMRIRSYVFLKVLYDHTRVEIYQQISHDNTFKVSTYSFTYFDVCHLAGIFHYYFGNKLKLISLIL